MDYVAEAWGSSTLAHDGPFSATCVSPCRSWERPPRRHQTPWRRSVPWRRCARCGARCGGRLERALHAAGEAPRLRLAPPEYEAEALDREELVGAEWPAQGGARQGPPLAMRVRLRLRGAKAAAVKPKGAVAPAVPIRGILRVPMRAAAAAPRECSWRCSAPPPRCSAPRGPSC